MAAELKPLLLDETGKEMRDGIKAITDAIKNTDTVQKAKEEIQAEGATQVANVQAASEEIIGKVEQIDQNTRGIDALKGDITKNALHDNVMKRRLDAIWKLNEGISYQFETDSENAYQKYVPSGAKLASVNQIGGKTIVWNQIIKQNAFPIVAEHNGVTVENNGDGSITINGTATGDAFINSALKNEVKCDHKYIILGDSGDCCFNVYDSTAIGGYGINAPYIFTSKATKELMLERIYVKQGVSANNVKIYPMLIDLTLMFGAGNEPSSVEEIKSMFPDDYYPYNTGTLLSTPVNDIVSEDNSGNVLQSAQVPDAVLNLDGYGDSVSDDVYNYVDWEKKQYVQRVGKADLGTLNWEYAQKEYAFYCIQPINAKNGVDYNGNPNGVCNKYQLVGQTSVIMLLDKQIEYGKTAYSVYGDIIIKDSSYTDAETFKQSMSSVMLYYELAKPVIIDISDLIPEDFNPIEVEAGGSLTFKNSNGDGYKVSVPNEVEYAVKLSEVV